MSVFRMSQILIWFLCACSLWWFLIHYIIFYRVFTYSGSGRDLAPVQLQAYVLKETVVCKNCLTCRCWGYVESGGECRGKKKWFHGQASQTKSALEYWVLFLSLPQNSCVMLGKSFKRNFSQVVTNWFECSAILVA